MLVSRLVWLTTAVVSYRFSASLAIWTLLGALIYPISALVNRLLGVKALMDKGNRLVSLAMKKTFFMLMCIPIAYSLSFQQPA